MTDTTEPYCNHDAPAVRNGICECGAIVPGTYGFAVGPSDFGPIGVISGPEFSASGNMVLRAGNALTKGGWTQSVHIVLTPTETGDYIASLVAAQTGRPHARLTDIQFRALLTLIMVSDPTPLNDADDNTILDLAHQESVARGYADWVVAYHEHPKVTS